MQDLDFYISKNGRYIMIENMIYDKALDRHANINEISFSDLIDIVGQNVAFLAQDIKTDLKEISSFTRKNAYHVFECFTETDKRLSLMMEYEVKFGSSLLTESITNPTKIIVETWGWIKEQVTILEQTYNPFKKDFWSKSNAKQIGSNVVSGAKSVGNAVVSGAKSVGNAILHPIDTIKKGWDWIKTNGLPAVMEKIRGFLYSGVGTAIQIFLQFTGAGNIGVAIVWGAMLVYDLYKVFTGKEWSWTDILFDVLGMISGGAVKVLRGAMKLAGVTKGMSMSKGLQTLAANPTTKSIMSKISSGISGVFNGLKNAANWLATKLGIKWAADVAVKAGTWLNTNILKPIASGLGNAVQGTRNVADKVLQKTGNTLGLKNVGNKTLSKANNVTVGSAARQGAIGGAEYKLQQNYVYKPAFDLYDKIRGVKPTGLSDDVVDQLDDMLG